MFGFGIYMVDCCCRILIGLVLCFIEQDCKGKSVNSGNWLYSQSGKEKWFRDSVFCI